MKFTAFGNCRDTGVAAAVLERGRVTGALYLDANDPRGIGLVAVSEDPAWFVTTFRDVLSSPPFDRMERKAELDMLGRTYSIGYEPDLEHVLFERPISRITDPALHWAVWYPLRRSKSFATLPAADQRRILAEHGTLGHRYGSAGLALDVRLACHGLDRNDNDFIIGLLGADLFPLSSIVQAMRSTEQTSRYLERASGRSSSGGRLGRDGGGPTVDDRGTALRRRRKPLRRPPRRLLRRSGRHGGCHAVPRQRARGVAAAGSGKARGRDALRAVRRGEPHQRPYPRARRGARGRARAQRAPPSASTGATATGTPS